MQRTSLWPPARPRLHCSTTILHTMTKPSSEFKKHSGRGPQPRARRSKCLQRPKAWNWTLSEKSDLPIIVLTEAKGEAEMLYRAESIATDYMARPFGPPMLRTRVRAWLARTSGPALLPEELPLTLRTAEKSKAEPGKEV